MDIISQGNWLAGELVGLEVERLRNQPAFAPEHEMPVGKFGPPTDSGNQDIVSPIERTDEELTRERLQVVHVVEEVAAVGQEVRPRQGILSFANHYRGAAVGRHLQDLSSAPVGKQNDI